MKRYIQSVETLDLRGQHLATLMPTSYKRTAQRIYSKVYDKISEDPSLISDLNTSSRKDVINRAISILIPDISPQISCYGIASTICAIFDKLSIDYTCYSGFAANKLGNYYYMPSNHVWVESQGNIYEIFPKISGEIYHYNISDTLIFE